MDSQSAQVQELENVFPDGFVTQIVKEGRLQHLFQFSLEYARNFNDFAPNCLPEDQEERRQGVIESFKRQIVDAIQANSTHCGKLLAAQGGRFDGTYHHYIQIQCISCGAHTVLTEYLEPVH